MAGIAALRPCVLLRGALALFVERASLGFDWLTPQIALVLDKYYWFHERHWHMFGLVPIAAWFAGTPFKNIFSRLEGVEMGKMVFDDGIRWTEYSLLEIGDYANFNTLSILWPHSLEEGVQVRSHQARQGLHALLRVAHPLRRDDGGSRGAGRERLPDERRDHGSLHHLARKSGESGRRPPAQRRRAGETSRKFVPAKVA
jgi:hypothetical protein